MQISRRHLLALSAGTAAVGAIGTGGVLISWWDQPAEDPYLSLSAKEGAFVRAWSGAAFPATQTIPLAGSNAGLDRFFDQMLQSVPSEMENLLKLLLNGLDALPSPSHSASFRELTQSDQRDLFDSWSKSDVGAFRSAVQSLTLLLGMGWSTHPDVAPFMQKLHSCGYGR